MARGQTIKILRTTRAALDAQAAASGLLAGELYLISDEGKLAVGTALNAYVNVGSSAAPYLLGYTIQGVTSANTTSLYYSGTTLTIPLDGRVYDFDFPNNNITIAFSGAPTAPVCADTVINLKQRASGTARAITAWPAGIKWSGGVPQTMPSTFNSRLKVVVSTSPSGVIDVSAMWMGV